MSVRSSGFRARLWAIPGRSREYRRRRTDVSLILRQMKPVLALIALSVLCSCGTGRIWAQGLGNAGTIDGTVTDPSGAVLPNATVTILNRLTNYTQTATTDSKGAFRLTNIPPNPYHVEVSAPNFSTSAQDLDVRSTVPVSLKVSLMVTGAQQTVTVRGSRCGPLGKCSVRPQRCGYVEPLQAFRFVARRRCQRCRDAQQRRRSRRFQWILSSSRGSCAD